VSEYRIITNGKKYRIQERVRKGLLWWKRERWETSGDLDTSCEPIIEWFAFEFATQEQAQQQIDKWKAAEKPSAPWVPVQKRSP
jgi:hypothetical protein